MQLIHFVRFVSRDGLSATMPFKQQNTALQAKAYRAMRSSLLLNNQTDDREPPKVGDADFKERSRSYYCAGVEVDDQTGVVTAIYLEE